MNYTIMLLDFISGDFEYTDQTAFIKRNGFNRLAYNMANMWAWNNLDMQREQGDGACVYINYETGA